MKIKQLALVAGLSGVLGVGALGLGGLTSAQNSGGQAAAQTNTQDASGLTSYEQNTIDIVNEYGPSVVSVNVTAQVQTQNQQVPQQLRDYLDQLPPQLRDFFDQQMQGSPQQQQQQPPQQAEGSGFVIDQAGRMITNFHVVRDTLRNNSVRYTQGSSITVTFPGSENEFPVTVVGVNTLYDLALIELRNPQDLPQNVKPIPIADSDNIQVGEKAIAIGNPFGLDSTVSAGIVSAVSRFAPSIGQVEVPYVQTDAAINPGNSGGPLLNSEGQVIGVNTQILAGGGGGFGQVGNIGIGFAVPSNLLQQSLAQLEQGGVVSLATRPRLGISIQSVSDYPESVRNNLNLPDQGIVVQEVSPGSAAARAGIQGSDFQVMYQGQQISAGGDVITAVDGTPVTTTAELQNDILNRNDGDTVTLTIVRGGQEQQVEVTLAQVPQQGGQNRQNQNNQQNQNN